MFDTEDTICVSDTIYSSHSMPLSSVLSEQVTLVSPNVSVPIKKIPSDNLVFVAINPILGFRNDSAVYKFKNFMLECDVGSIDSQVKYLKQLGIPYSAIIYSGSKSAHVLITLSKPIDEKSYRVIYQWLLNIGTLFDPACRNPSRSIRIAGAIRPETGKEQELLEFKGVVENSDLFNYLKLRPEGKPQVRKKKPRSGELDIERLPNWVADRLVNGLDPTKGRNQTFFSISIEFALAGYSEDETISILEEYFVEDVDFKRKEWESAIRSGIKYVDEKYR